MEQMEWIGFPRSLDLKEDKLLQEVRQAGFIIDVRGIRPLLMRGLYSVECNDIEDALVKALAWVYLVERRSLHIILVDHGAGL